MHVTVVTALNSNQACFVSAVKMLKDASESESTHMFILRWLAFVSLCSLVKWILCSYNFSKIIKYISQKTARRSIKYLIAGFGFVQYFKGEIFWLIFYRFQRISKKIINFKKKNSLF